MEKILEFDIYRTRNTIIEMLGDRGFSTENIPKFTLQTIQTIVSDKGDKEFENIFYIFSQKIDSEEWLQGIQSKKSYPNILKIDFRDTRILGEALVDGGEDKGVVEEPGKQKFYEYLFIEDASRVTPGSMVIITDFQDKFFQQLGVIQDVLSDGTIMTWIRGHDDAFPYQKDQLNLVIERDVVQPSGGMPQAQAQTEEYAVTSPVEEYTYQPNSPIEAMEHTYQPTSPVGADGEYYPTTPPYNPGSPAYNPGSPAYNPGSPAYTPGSPVYNPDTPPSQMFTPYTTGEAMGATVGHTGAEGLQASGHDVGGGGGGEGGEGEGDVDDAGTPKSVELGGGNRSFEQQGGAKKTDHEDDEENEHKNIKVDIFDKMRKTIRKQRGGMRSGRKRKKMTKKDLGIPESIEVHFVYPNNSKKRIKKSLSEFGKQGGDHTTTDIIFVVFDTYKKELGFSGLMSLLETYKQFETPSIQVFHYEQLLINITKHEYVPKHTLLEPLEIETLLDKHYLNSINGLPSILTTDPITRYYGAKENNVFKIERSSKTFGHSIYYRKVVIGNSESDN